jgi:NAD(P)-dependent dehydrogenase (short-subunit alcohol dehydrogenase family)
MTSDLRAGRLSGKRAVVIGAGQTPGVSTGIGRATALVFAREGATVLLIDRDEASAQETKSLIEAEGGSASVFLADVTDEKACAAIAAAALERLSGVDVLFDGIGILGLGRPHEVSEELWDRVFDVNLKAKWLVTKHIAPIMVKQRSGSIVYVSSIAARRDGALRGISTPYAVSKAGVDRLAVAVAAAYAEYDVRANTILPGLVDTPMAIDATLASGASRADVVAERLETVPMSFTADAFDVAYAALYFASDESRYVSGQCLAVDGARGAS